MARLSADFSSAFRRDLKKKARRRGWDLSELEKVIDLVVENSPESLEVLTTRHNMHVLSGNWSGRKECHVTNAGGLARNLVIKRQGRLLRENGRAR